MARLSFRLTSNPDPEERLEEAALWKAMHDEYGDSIEALPEGSKGSAGAPTFGRPLRQPSGGGLNPVSNRLDYWKDPAFLDHAVRSFAVCPFEEAEGAVRALHDRGLAAFVKSTRSKHAIFRVPVGSSFASVIGDMAYSFMDGGPGLMVQEECRIEYEHRFFCIGREIVADSPVQSSLTPIDFPLPGGTVYRRPDSTEPETRPEVTDNLRNLAERIAAEMACPHASVDCAYVNGRPGAVEFNPMRLGQLGLYAADVRALAKASRKLLQNPETEEDMDGPMLVVHR